jgi:hypothetical protein
VISSSLRCTWSVWLKLQGVSITGGVSDFNAVGKVSIRGGGNVSALGTYHSCDISRP